MIYTVRAKCLLISRAISLGMAVLRSKGALRSRLPLIFVCPLPWLTLLVSGEPHELDELDELGELGVDEPWLASTEVDAEPAKLSGLAVLAAVPAGLAGPARPAVSELSALLGFRVWLALVLVVSRGMKPL